jgi:hypothetical protein
METRFREMAQHFLDANIIRITDLSQFRKIMQRTRRLRDWKLPEFIVIVAVYTQVGYLVDSGRIGLVPWAVDAGSGSITPAGYYSLLVTQALFLTLLSIAAWKWLIWVDVLRQISECISSWMRPMVISRQAWVFSATFRSRSCRLSWACQRWREPTGGRRYWLVS